MQAGRAYRAPIPLGSIRTLLAPALGNLTTAALAYTAAMESGPW